MQSRVYPDNVVLRGFREVVAKDGDSYIRTLGIGVAVYLICLHAKKRLAPSV